MADPIIGIDLGTSNCSVAVVGGDGQPVVLADAKGRRVVPSIVSFHPSGEVLVGAEAKHRRQNDPRNTIFSVKRFLGRPFAATEVAEARHRSPFVIERGEQDRPMIVTRAGKFTAEEISAVILDHMRKLAEKAMGRPVERAVITVPANFNEAQRHATAAAAEIAGIVAVRLLNEPTAAAIAYGHGKKTNQTIAVYDFGGGTFDVSVLRLHEGVYEVLATAGDMFLGGDDVDNRLVDHEVKQFLAKHRYDLRADPQVIERLRATMEEVKCELSTKLRAVVTAEGVAAGAGGAPLDLSSALTRDQFVALVKDIVDRSFPVVDEALKLAGLPAKHIDEIILVGGTTRIPYVRERVAQYFGKPPRTDVDPDQAVALGAAIQAGGIASLLDRRGSGAAGTGVVRPTVKGVAPATSATVLAKDIPVMDASLIAEVLDQPSGKVRLPPSVEQAFMPHTAPKLMEVTPRALCVATVGGFCEELIPRNIRIPLERTREFSTAKDDQEIVEILVMCGESRRQEENERLGVLTLSGLPPRPRGEVKIIVSFSLSPDGILHVSATDQATGIAQTARIQLEGVLTGEDILAAKDRFASLRG